MAIAIITGASSGMGERFAEEIDKTGEVDGLLLVARRRSRLAAVRDRLKHPTEILEADLGTTEGIAAVRVWLAAHRPVVRYLINAAGYGIFGDYTQVSEKDTIGMIDLNSKATVLLSHMVIPYMLPDSHLLIISSSSAFTPLPGFNVYSATKAFVYHYAKALAYEVRDRGIGVTVFCPGWVNTAFFDRAETEKAEGPHVKKPMLTVAYAVGCAMRAMKKQKLLCTCNWYTKMQHLGAKILPDSWLIVAWLRMLKK